MTTKFKIVDLFAGPGGLAEGFSAVKDKQGNPVFEIVCSVEKETSAFATLRLRAFTRQFHRLPELYYKYLAKEVSQSALIEKYPNEWEKACNETFQLELGTAHAKAILYPKLDELKKSCDGNLILVGGPPCQAYSLVGRARNQGIVGYEASEDLRHFLYKEYIDIIGICNPIAFVMENVKGLLSASVSSTSVFERILTDLKLAGGLGRRYRLISLGESTNDLQTDFVLKSEDFGVPQKRHRVIIVGVRQDVETNDVLAKTLFENLRSPQINIRTVLHSLPKLRSGLSKLDDSVATWRKAMVSSLNFAATACRNGTKELKPVRKRLTDCAVKIRANKRSFPRFSTTTGEPSDLALKRWIYDDRLVSLPNHETRGHIQADLARYAFAEAFAEIHGRSPKAKEFPTALAPNHKNWTSGKFVDRFRVQVWDSPSSTITSHISKDGHFFIHPDLNQCRSLTVREAARIQTFPDNYLFEGTRTQQFVQVGNAVPPLLAFKIAKYINALIKT
jgi:DNA (cytosine-5)-methyltransferase 1